MEAVDVLEPRIDIVEQADAEEVLEDATVFEFVELELDVLDCVVEEDSVLEEVVVFVDVPLPVVVLEDVTELERRGEDEEVLDVALVFVNAHVGLIV